MSKVKTPTKKAGPSYRLYNILVDVGSEGNMTLSVSNVTAVEIAVIRKLNTDGVADPIKSIEDAGVDINISTKDLYDRVMHKYGVRPSNRSMIERDFGVIVAQGGRFVERIEGVIHRDEEEPTIEIHDSNTAGAAEVKAV